MESVSAISSAHVAPCRGAVQAHVARAPLRPRCCLTDASVPWAAGLPTTDSNCIAGLSPSTDQSGRHAWPTWYQSGMSRSLLVTVVPCTYLRFVALHSCLCRRAASATEVNRSEVQQFKEAPKPIVKIDNQHDPFATVVSIQYGNKLGELLDTVALLPTVLYHIEVLCMAPKFVLDSVWSVQTQARPAEW